MIKWKTLSGGARIKFINSLRKTQLQGPEREQMPILIDRNESHTKCNNESLHTVNSDSSGRSFMHPTYFGHSC